MESGAAYQCLEDIKKHLKRLTELKEKEVFISEKILALMLALLEKTKQ